jgi:spore maturation protein CgeB
MQSALRLLLTDRETAQGLAANARKAVLARHTCAHRAQQLLEIVAALRAAPPNASTRLEGALA